MVVLVVQGWYQNFYLSIVLCSGRQFSNERVQVRPGTPRQLRGLPRPRHSHGNHVERGRRHGRRPPPHRRQRELPAATGTLDSCTYK